MPRAPPSVGREIDVDPRIRTLKRIRIRVYALLLFKLPSTQPRILFTSLSHFFEIKPWFEGLIRNRVVDA